VNALLDFYAKHSRLFDQIGLNALLALSLSVSLQAGQLALAYRVYRCWISEYIALDELDAAANAVAIESIKIENEGWERDLSVTEPTPPALEGR